MHILSYWHRLVWKYLGKLGGILPLNFFAIWLWETSMQTKAFWRLASGKEHHPRKMPLPTHAVTSAHPFPTRHTRIIQQHKHGWSSPDAVSSCLTELPEEKKRLLKECDKNLTRTQFRLSSFGPRKRKINITPEVGEMIVYFSFFPIGMFALLATKNLLFKIQVLCCQERGECLPMVIVFTQCLWLLFCSEKECGSASTGLVGISSPTVIKILR